jgi:hypothetical protein
VTPFLVGVLVANEREVLAAPEAVEQVVDGGGRFSSTAG